MRKQLFNWWPWRYGFCIYVGEEYQMPAWYGVYYYNVQIRKVGLLPFPLHFPAQLVRNSYYWAMFRIWESQKEKAYKEGYELGWTDGHKQGSKHSY